MNIYCCNCTEEIDATLTNGAEIYPHRKDLKNLPFWKCTTCNSFVGCHHKTSDPTKPLGVIPSEDIKRQRKFIHSILDPIWKSKVMPRRKVYSLLSEHLGYTYHTAEIRSVEEGNKVIDIINRIKQ